MRRVAPKPGDRLVGPYPMIRTTYDDGDPEGGPRESWKPGVEWVAVHPDNQRPEADAMGSVALTVISIHKPGGYPERVFYLQQWIAPDGREFGKRKLRVTTTAAFLRRARGYRYSDFVLRGQAIGAAP